MRARSLGAVFAAAGLVAACSANTPAPAQSSTSVAPTGHGGFAHCLSEHGVPAPPGAAAGPPPGVDKDTWQRAMQACSTLAPGPAG
ncbi:hypothetical protein [Mycolicibacterium moriokaense]|uniref:hypothetical protein n=1 Tax=Mycolicibacterium moriokaense TaxID=39691 RepID=UPI000D756444|nr:hypothetical protein [Mycolicibacterium moriokaense]